MKPVPGSCESAVERNEARCWELPPNMGLQPAVRTPRLSPGRSAGGRRAQFSRQEARHPRRKEGHRCNLEAC